MIRALTTLAGLICAGALLLLVPDVGSADGGGLWKRAALLAAAGLVAGVLYQLGGIRRRGVCLSTPMLLGAFLPWTVFALALCLHRTGTPSSLTDLVRDVVPAGALTRWSPSFPILAFVDGLLLAFVIEPLGEPRVGVPEVKRVEEVEEVEEVDSHRPAALAGRSMD